MTTIDKIRAEIERRIKSCDATSKTPNQLLWAELSALLPFLDTLEEPVSDCHDLTEAAEKSARQYYVDGGYSPFPNTEMASHIAGFKAGAEWMAKQGVSYQATISADKTIPVLPMKDVSDMGLDYGDKVRIIIVKEDKK